MSDLSQSTCAPCEGHGDALTDDALALLKSKLNPEWEMDLTSQNLTRKFTFKAFAKAVYTANLVAYICDKEGHHADIAFGWGYCTVVFTSHEVGRLSENDFICAAKVDAAV
jgi:4a-hydroxytetrahydrobiopterin dehydratase